MTRSILTYYFHELLQDKPAVTNGHVDENKDENKKLDEEEVTEEAKKLVETMTGPDGVSRKKGVQSLLSFFVDLF